MTDFAIAALVYDGEGDDAAAALWQAARAAQADGRRAAGLLNPLDKQGRHIKSQLVSVADGQSFEIFQQLGSGSQGCKLDGRLLAEAASVLRRAADEGADILFFNKFGHAEIENRGLNAEYLAAASAGIPVLTAVCRKYLDDWRQFCGGSGDELPPEPEAASAWARAAAGRAQP